MKCDDVLPLLSLHLYGDLADSEGDLVREHLAGCARCRTEEQALKHTRTALDAVPSPEAVISPAQIVRIESDRRLRSLRRWRRGAIFSGALAASLAFVLLVQPSIFVGDGALTIRWSEPKSVVQIPVPHERDVELAEHVELLGKLVRALADESDGRDRERKTEIATIKARLDLLSVMTNTRMEETRRDMSVIYRAQFPKREGE